MVMAKVNYAIDAGDSMLDDVSKDLQRLLGLTRKMEGISKTLELAEGTRCLAQLVSFFQDIQTGKTPDAFQSTPAVQVTN
jgi:hypothetical protein